MSASGRSRKPAQGGQARASNRGAARRRASATGAGSRRGEARPAARFQAVRDLLDHELIDADGVPCGVVDDVVLDGDAGAPLRVVALLVGTGAWLPRLPGWVAWLIPRALRAGPVRVAWSAVAHAGERIKLADSASALGLGRTDRRIGRWIARIPGGLRAPE